MMKISEIVKLFKNVENRFISLFQKVPVCFEKIIPNVNAGLKIIQLDWRRRRLLEKISNSLFPL